MIKLVAEQKEISILKLDIQGAEKGVLSSSQGAFRKQKASILEGDLHCPLRKMMPDFPSFTN